MNINNSFLKGILVACFIFTGIITAFAQPLPPAPQTPISGGLGIMILLGLFFGIRKKFKK